MKNARLDGGSCAWVWVLGPALGKEVPAHAQHVSGLDGFEQSVVDAIKGEGNGSAYEQTGCSKKDLSKGGGGWPC